MVRFVLVVLALLVSASVSMAQTVPIKPLVSASAFRFDGTAIRGEPILVSGEQLRQMDYMHVRWVVLDQSETLLYGNDEGKHYVIDLPAGGLSSSVVGEAAYFVAEKGNNPGGARVFKGSRMHTVYVWNMALDAVGTDAHFVDGFGKVYIARPRPPVPGERLPLMDGQPPQAIYMVETSGGYGGLRMPSRAWTASTVWLICPPAADTLYPRQDLGYCAEPGDQNHGEFCGLRISAAQFQRAHASMYRNNQHWTHAVFVVP